MSRDKPRLPSTRIHQRYMRMAQANVLQSTVCVGLVLLLCVLLQVEAGEDFYGLLGVNKEASPKEIRQAFKKKALSMHPDKNSDNPDAHDIFLKINRAYEVLKDEELRKKYDQFGEEGLKENSPSGGGYRSWKFYQQEFGLYDDDPNIITLSRSDFEVSVDNTRDIWFVNYYSPHCGHCHDLAPSWKQLAQDLDGVVRVGAVNCEDDWMLCRQKGITGYPALIMYPTGERYRGERTLREMTRFVLKNVKADVTELWSGNFDSVTNSAAKVSHPWAINFCGDSGDCMQKQSVKKLAAMLNDLVNVGSIDCRSNKKLCSNLGVEYGLYFFPTGQLTKGKGISISSLDAKEVASELLKQLPDVKLLDSSSLQAILQQQGSPWLIHFVQGDESDLELRKLPMLLNTIQVGRVNCQMMRTDCNHLHIHKFPTFVLFKSTGGHEIHHGRLSAPDVAAFARDSAQSGVTVLGPEDFPGRVVQGQDPWFVDFYAPWCPPCMRLLPEFRKASKQIPNPNVHFGTVDCTVHPGLCQMYNVHSYPTTIFYNQTVPHQFHGQHSAHALIEFIQDTLNPPVQALTPHSFHEIVGLKDASQTVLVDFFAPWCGPCQQLAPEWRKLAKMMRNTPNVKVTQVDCQTHGSLCAAQGINGYPTIRLYPQGSTGSHNHMRYQGWMRNANALRSWMFSYLPSKSTVLSDHTFVETVLKTTQPFLVDFYTPWCGHCQHFAPEFERIAQEMDGVVQTAKVNCDENRQTCQQAGVRAYPTVRFYQGARHGYQQNYHGVEINSQNGDYIISFLAQYGLRKKQIRDEL